jgi:hypothetical protein
LPRSGKRKSAKGDGTPSSGGKLKCKKKEAPPEEGQEDEHDASGSDDAAYEREVALEARLRDMLDNMEEVVAEGDEDEDQEEEVAEGDEEEEEEVQGGGAAVNTLGDLQEDEEGDEKAQGECSGVTAEEEQPDVPEATLYAGLLPLSSSPLSSRPSQVVTTNEGPPGLPHHEAHQDEWGQEEPEEGGRKRRASGRTTSFNTSPPTPSGLASPTSPQARGTKRVCTSPANRR